MKPSEFHPAARREADRAFRWYADQSASAAQRFRDELGIAVERIRTDQMRYPVYLLGTRRCLFDSFPYLLVFLDKPDRVQVIAVAHGKRRPGYWRRRLPKQ